VGACLPYSLVMRLVILLLISKETIPAKFCVGGPQYQTGIRVVAAGVCSSMSSQQSPFQLLSKAGEILRGITVVIADHHSIQDGAAPDIARIGRQIVPGRDPRTLRLAPLSPCALRPGRCSTILIAWNCAISGISSQSPRKDILLERQYELA
jgi:hypothetical protein